MCISIHWRTVGSSIHLPPATPRSIHTSLPTSVNVRCGMYRSADFMQTYFSGT